MQQQQATCRAGLAAGWLHPGCHSDALCVGSSSGDQLHFAAVRRRRGRTHAGGQHLLRQPQAAGPPAPEPSAGAFSQGECIEVEASFDAAEGAALLGGRLVVGRHIGAGSAADVYTLTAVSGSGGGGQAAETAADAAAPAQVLKWIKPVPGLRRAFKREWIIGRRLNAAALADPALGILLQTGPAVVSHAGKGGKGGGKASSSGRDLVFRGAVLQALAGQSLDKRLEADGSFCDIDYLTACLQAVLTALDRGSALVGFEHGDLRISNIMEHSPDPAALQHLSRDCHTWRSAGHESAASAAMAAGLLTFKLVDTPGFPPITV